MSEGLVIEKPATDFREYRPLDLENGMRVMLISDSKCDKAAAALSVKVGSLFDPSEVQGLAHFCEHMLFLGTEKYPREEEYNEFLAKHGGSSNAYTAETLTNFFFGVSPQHLEGALDRFAQFFLCPLFTESATDRELNAVESEHSKNQQSDAWRWNQLIRREVNPKHPFCHFGTGSYETLKTLPEQSGCPVRERLLDFHSKYFSANIMCLVILGKESLEELEALVRKYFEQVGNQKVVMPTGPEVGGGEPVFAPESLPRFVRAIPVRSRRTLIFQFMLPQQHPMRWRTKPGRYASFLLGHEGQGSLLSALKLRGLATGLSAGPSTDESGICVFEVGMELTEKGESEVKLVGELLFSYVRLVQALPVSEELFRETQAIEEMNFRFRSVGNPVSTASGLAHAMQDGLPIDKVLSGPAKVWELDKAGIKDFVAWLTCSQLRVFMATSSFTEADCQEVERWYGTKYSTQTLPANWHEAWEARRCGDNSAEGEDAVAAAAEAAGKEFGLHMPVANPFIAQDLDLKQKPQEGVPKYPIHVRPLPACLTDSCAGLGSRFQVYFRQDDTFDLPKACLNIEFYCPWTAESTENVFITKGWCSAVMEELNEYSYDAETAGLIYALQPGHRGINLALTGYQHKLPVLLRAVVSKMVEMTEVSEHTWGLIYTVMLRQARASAKNKQPYQQAFEWESRALSMRAVTANEALKVVEGLTVDRLSNVNKRLLECCYIEAHLQGNFTQDEVGTVFEPLLPVLRLYDPSARGEPLVPGLGTGELPDGSNSCVLLRQVGTNPDEKNGAVMLTLQAADEDMRTYVLVELASQVLSQRCFDELRTKQQLGYIVALQPYFDNQWSGFCGLKIIVQSEMHPAEVHRRVDTWLSEALAKLVEEDEEQMNEYVEALTSAKKERPKKLAEEVVLNWAQVRARTFRFSYREEVVELLEGPRSELLEDFRQFVKDKLIPAPRIATQVLGAAAAAAASAPSTPSGPLQWLGVAAADAATRPYEGACRYMDSLEEVEKFRAGLSFRMSNTELQSCD